MITINNDELEIKGDSRDLFTECIMLFSSFKDLNFYQFLKIHTKLDFTVQAIFKNKKTSVSNETFSKIIENLINLIELCDELTKFIKEVKNDNKKPNTGKIDN